MLSSRSFSLAVAIITLVVSSLLAQETTAPAQDKTVEVKAGEVTLHVPEDWKATKPSSRMRLAQFAIEPADGDSEGAELAIFPPFGGTVAANVQRWVGQFSGEGRELKMTQGEAEQGKYVLVDITGTYNKPDGPPIMRKTKPTPNYRMLAVVFSKTDGGNYFFKLTGPKNTVTEAADEFRATFGGDAEKESAYSF